MPLTMYSASVPVFARMLRNLDAVLDRAAEHAQSRKIDPAVLLAARLYPDMLPFARQVQIATDAAKGCAARLAGLEVPKFDDTEASFAELKARVARTIDFVESVDAQRFDGSETRTITIPLRQGERQFDGETYLKHFALPNFYFHVTTAYAILRHNGIELGKTDFLGR
jgi:uncharacterized protein